VVNRRAHRPVLALLLSATLGSALEPRSDHAAAGCRNTVQGRTLMVDDKGLVCPVDGLDYSTGCCLPQTALSEPYSCAACEAETFCCPVYEHCVACCMGPSQATHRAEAMKSVASKKTFAKAVGSNDAFEFCRATCRTSSKSTVHGNEYLSPTRFCLSPFTIATKLPPSVSAVPGDQGLSCTQVCKAQKKRCDARFFAAINNCDHLKAAFAPCATPDRCVTNMGHDQPAFVASPNNKELFGKCLINSKESYFSCQGSHPDTRRICPCSAA